MPSPPDVFVSYNRADRAWAEWIAWVLEEAGYSVTIQAWDFRPGGNFVLYMQQATSARHTVAVLSPSYLAAEYTQPEWAAAFARDPRGASRALIPVRVQECRPEGLLAQIVYADLVGLDETGARRTLLDAFPERGKPPTQPPFPGGPRTILAKPSFPSAPSTSNPLVSIAQLPVTGETFVAREEELARLGAAWSGGTNVLSFVAMGGAGKSALINRWLDRMQQDGWRGAERVLGWSFYSQGTDAVGASGEAFTEFALGWLGYEGEVITSPWKKGEVLARLVREARTLLLLDGLEPLQYPPGAQTGRIKDPSVQALVRELAAENPGLCVITTRLAVADVAGRAGAEAVDLEKLPTEAGAELLRKLGVEGSDKEMRAASEEFGGHGLALTLLGTYLRDVCDGDVRRRGEVAVLDSGVEGADHARRVMASYEKWLGPAELQVLSLLGLFDRPAEAAAVAALRTAPEIPSLTEGVGAGEEKAWKLALARLRQARLVAEEAGDAGSLDAHPLVREHFGERLRQAAPEAWREGNERLYEHYKQAAPEYPETLEAMLPLYAAVVHGCRAERVQEAFDDVAMRRIWQGNKSFSVKKFRAFGAELTALSALFDRPWSRPSTRLRAKDQAWLLNSIGFVLRALGRMPEAVQPIETAVDLAVRQGSWDHAATGASNLSELALMLGRMEEALAAGERSVTFADRSSDPVERVLSRATLAHALHQAGRLEESASTFRQAEVIQAAIQPKHPHLYSLQGYQYCDLLLSQVDSQEPGVEPEEVIRQVCEEVRKRADQAIDWEQQMPEAPILDFALHYLILARTTLSLAQSAAAVTPDLRWAAGHVDRAVDGLRQAASEPYIPFGLLARAALRRIASDAKGAVADLREAQEIAERGSMRLHEADAHLEWTRLHLQTGDLSAARTHLDRAAELVRECGYGRREREVAWLEGRLAGASTQP